MVAELLGLLDPQQAADEALRERLESVRREESFEVLWSEVAEIRDFVARLPDRDTRSPDEILCYDDHGLPG